MLTWIGLWPTVTVVMWVVHPQLQALPMPLQTMLMTAIIVPLMAWSAAATRPSWRRRSSRMSPD